eukprot:UN33779
MKYVYYRYRNISGKTVLITGGAGGLGKEMAIKFTKEGCKVVVWDLADCAETIKTVKEKTGVEIKGYQCDVTNEKLIKQLAKKVEEEVGEVDILINNAGIVGGSPILESNSKNDSENF